MRVLSARAGLSHRYELVAAGLENIVAFLGGQGHELDYNVLGPAFGVNWGLEGEYPAELPGANFFKKEGKVVFITFVAARPDQQIAPAEGLASALEAVAAWPSEVSVDSFEWLADFELVCQREAEERLRTGGLPALWELAETQSEQYRRVAELLVG